MREGKSWGNEVGTARTKGGQIRRSLGFSLVAFPGSKAFPTSNRATQTTWHATEMILSEQREDSGDARDRGSSSCARLGPGEGDGDSGLRRPAPNRLRRKRVWKANHERQVLLAKDRQRSRAVCEESGDDHRRLPGAVVCNAKSVWKSSARIAPQDSAAVPIVRRGFCFTYSP